MIVKDKTISTQEREEVKSALMKEYPYLYFYVGNEGAVSAWVRTPDGRDGAGITFDRPITVSNLDFHSNYLKELNEKVKLACIDSCNYFYCSECGEVKPKEEFADFVMASLYCKDCAEKPLIATMIAESHKKGFYD